MLNNIKSAAEFALLWGIKIGGTILIIAALNLAWMGDYWSIRQMALHGEQIYQTVLQQQQVQKAAAAQPHQEPK